MRLPSKIQTLHRNVRRKRLRAATTLIETVAMMIIIGSLLSISGVAIHRTTQLQKLSLSFIRQEKLLDDFQQQLRNDVQSASEIKIQDNGLTIEDSGKTVEYSLDESKAIQRRVKNSAGEVVGMNRWRVAAQALKFEQELQEKVPLLHCHLRLSQAPPSAEPQGTIITPDNNQASDTPASLPKSEMSPELREIHWLLRVGVHK